MVGPVSLPIEIGVIEATVRWFVGRTVDSSRKSGAAFEEVSVLQFGELNDEQSRPLVRVHSACLTGDTLGSLRCDCGPQLRSAIRQLVDASSGSLLVYMTSHEGRGIGLWSKAAAYLLQEEGLDTYAANRALAFGDDQRDFRLAAAVIVHLLRDAPFELLTNNPLKVRSLERFGVLEVSRRGLVQGASAHNRCYLRAKREHGHFLPDPPVD
ncbi:MAG: GTP cyclohydrolase II [bacterium]|nr:GTP cyclohydrolase II [bacterium]